MDTSWILLVWILLEGTANGAVKTWIKDQSEPWGESNVNSNECTIFKKELEGFLYMDAQEHHLQEVILPVDGALVLPTQSKVQFSNTNQCEADENEAHFLGKSKRLWFSTSSWQSEGESVNVAKADIFKIPCECDTVEFPSKNIYAVDLQFVDEIVVDQILINDRTDNIEQFLETPLGQKMFLNSEAVHFSKGFCDPQKYCGCHNQNRFKKYTEVLCEEESKYCKEPHCLNPIKPEGHCCPICGAILNFKTQDSCDFNMTNMREVGRKLRRFRNGKYLNKLHYYAGMVPGKTNTENIVQLVVAEVDDYSGISVEFMDYLTKDQHFQVDALRERISSGDRYVRGESSALTIIFFTFLFVLSIYVVIYVHYVREPKYDTWMPITRLNLLRRSVAFARFENLHNDDENGRIDVGVRYESGDEYDDEANEKPNECNNPMYEQVAMGSVETDMLQPSSTTLQQTDEAGSLSTDIKLVDISLNAIEM
ncbi:protein amnionless [Contarinia nasturtii]|uniref:protein amnionless n=1 Tax=Contarinia nasturtii TaxID=265458 RepID=UPI0012D396D3|nr:protein amnionless [Contarinia nasturtii]